MRKLFSGSLNTTLSISHNLLNSVARIENISNINSVNFLINIANNCKEKSYEADAFLINNNTLVSTLLNEIFIKEYGIEDFNKETKKLWHKLLNFLKNAPKASN